MSKGRIINSDSHIDDCISCQAPIFVGDRGYSYDDGPKCCEKCAPTWDEAKENWVAQEDDRPDDVAKFMRDYDEHMAAGGKPTDRILQDI